MVSASLLSAVEPCRWWSGLLNPDICVAALCLMESPVSWSVSPTAHWLLSSNSWEDSVSADVITFNWWWHLTRLTDITLSVCAVCWPHFVGFVVTDVQVVMRRTSLVSCSRRPTVSTWGWTVCKRESTCWQWRSHSWTPLWRKVDKIHPSIIHPSSIYPSIHPSKLRLHLSIAHWNVQ